MGIERAEQADVTGAGVREPRRSIRLPPLWLFGALAASLLLAAAAKDTSDVFEYHCYALDFWQGGQAASALRYFPVSAPSPLVYCPNKIAGLAQAPFHELPREYGPLSLLIFSLPLLAPLAWYDTVFNLLMCAVILVIAWLLDRFGPRGAGHVWLVYTLLGVMLEAAGRFDAVAAGAVLVALLAAQRGRSLLAYGALAAGALLKFFPLALLPLLLISSWKRRRVEPFWRGPALFAAITLVGEGIAALINPAHALDPLTFMRARCVEVESGPATLGFLWANLTGQAVGTNPVDAYGSVCQFGPGLDVAQTLATIAAGIGMLVVFWLVWRGRLTLAQGFLFATGLIILGVKVFSVQYLLWLSPLVAYVYGTDLLALLGWGAVMLATALYYPVASNPWVVVHFGFWLVYHLPLLVAFRNVLMVAVGALGLRDALRRTGAAGAGAAASNVESAVAVGSGSPP